VYFGKQILSFGLKYWLHFSSHSAVCPQTLYAPHR